MFCLDLWVSLLHLAATSRKLPVLCLFHSSLFLLSPLHHSVWFFLSLSPSYLPQVFRYLPPGCCCWCWEVQGALLSSCQGLCGPRGAPAERTRTPLLSRHIPFDEGYGMEGVMWGWLKTDGSQSQNCVCVWDCRDGLHSPAALSCPTLLLKEAQRGQMHLPEIHTLGSDDYLSHLQGFKETQHVHTLVSAYARLKREHRGTSGNPHLRNQKFEFK